METTTVTLSSVEPLSSIEGLSEYLNVRVRTFNDWRLTGEGPCVIHVGRQLRYFVSDVQARPRIPIGTFGDISNVKVSSGSFRVRTRYRDGDGRVRYGVHRAWVYKLKAHYEAEGETALQPRSRRPKTSALSPEEVDLIVRIRKELSDAGLDAGAETIAWHLEHHHPKKRPKSSYLRFQASMPNETWQSDFTGSPPRRPARRRH